MPIAGMTTKRRGAVMGSDAFSPTGEQLDDAGTTETVFFVHYDRRSQMIILPRQARDKYKGQLNKIGRFLAGAGGAGANLRRRGAVSGLLPSPIMLPSPGSPSGAGSPSSHSSAFSRLGLGTRKRPVLTSHLLLISSKTFICQDRLT